MISEATIGRKIRVLYGVGTLSQDSGVTTVIMNAVRHLDPVEFQIDVAVHHPPAEVLENEIKARGGNVILLPEPNLRNAALLFCSLDKLFRTVEPSYDLVHVHAPNLAAAYFLTARKQGIAARIVHSHNTKFSDSPVKAARNYLLTRPLVHLATHYIACSESAGAFLFGARNMDRGKVMILPNGVDVPRFRFRPEIRMDARNELGLEDAFVLGHIGRFDLQKNHSFLVDIFHEIRKRKGNAVLLLIGDGDLEPLIQTKVEELGLREHVLFLGRRSDVDRLLQVMDVFVLPSLYEGLPLVGVEAQTAGLPCLFSDRITRELQVTDRMEFLPLESGAKAWAETILRVDASRVRENAFRQVEEAGYDLRASVGKLRAFYLRSLEGR